MTGIIIFIVVIMAIVARRLYVSRVSAAWNEAARRLGITARTPGRLDQFELTGSLDEFPLGVVVAKRGDQRVTEYSVMYPPIGLGLKLTKQTIGTQLRSLLGAADHLVGNESFDDKMAVESSQPQRLASYFTPERMAAIQDLIGAYPNAVISDRRIVVTVRGVASDASQIVRAARAITATAGVVTDARLPSAEPEPSPPRTAHPGNTVAFDDLYQRANQAFDELLESKQTETGAHRDAESSDADSERAARSEIPVSDEYAWSEDAVPHDDSPPEPRHVESVEPPIDGEPLAVGRALFGSNASSREITDLFEDTYSGTRVEWTGTLQRAHEYSTDLDFRDGPGTKAFVVIATIERDLYGKTDIEAVVGFPAQTARLLQRRGEAVTFRGTLAAVDPLMRRIRVTDAELVG